MPIHELGYRHWDGPLRPRWTRFWSITRTGIALARRPKIVRRLSLLALVPVLYLGLVFYGIGLITDPDNSTVPPFFRGLIRELLTARFYESLQTDPGAMRLAIWNDSFHAMFVWWLPSVALITIAVAPKLIASDLRTKAYLIYFSKPATRVDYLIGKAGIVGAYVAWFTFVPATCVYLLSILFAPTIDALTQTWTVLPRIFLASLIVIVPVTALALYVSSISKDERITSFGMIVVVVGGEVVNFVDQLTTDFEGTMLPVFACIRVTLWNGIANAFETPVVPAMLPETTAPRTALAYLAILTTLCSIGLWRRISAPMRV